MTKTDGCNVYYASEVGKKFFITKSEAEQALEAMGAAVDNTPDLTP
jgi:hypothetical protein